MSNTVTTHARYFTLLNTVIVKTAVLSTVDFGNCTAFASDVTLQNIIMHKYTTSHYRNIVEANANSNVE